MGLKRYFTGKACPNGHVAERIVSTRACSACSYERAREWKERNPDRCAELHRRWFAENHDRARELKLDEQKRNRIGANRRQKRYRDKNHQRTLEATAKWAKLNPHAGAAKNARYRAAILKQMPKWADAEEISGMYWLCGVFRSIGMDLHVDHIIPLRGRAVSGLHVAENLQLIHSSQNRAKSNSFAL